MKDDARRSGAICVKMLWWRNSAGEVKARYSFMPGWSTLVISDASKRWIQAGIALGNDPTALVPCPDCGKRNLIVEDIPLRWVMSKDSGIEWDTPHIDRLMRCPECGFHNYLLMRTPDS